MTNKGKAPHASKQRQSPSQARATSHSQSGTSVVKEDSAYVTLDVLCPLCLGARVEDPVRLHQLPDDQATEHCVACRACYQKWASALESPHCKCPLCALEVKLNAEEPSTVNAALPVANPVTDSNIRGSEEGTTCGVCEKNPAAVMCLQCTFALCAECQGLIHSKGRFREHEVIPVENARHRVPFHCELHTTQSLDLFCQSCQMGVCVTCCFGGDHRGHEVIPLSDTATDARTRMSTMASTFEETSTASKDIAERLATLIPMTEVRVNNLRAEVQQTFAALRQTLEERETVLLGQLSAMEGEMKSSVLNGERRSGAMSEILARCSYQLRGLITTLNPLTLMRVISRVDACREALLQMSQAQIAAADRHEAELRGRIHNGGLATFKIFATDATNGTASSEHCQQLLRRLGHVLPVAAEDAAQFVEGPGFDKETTAVPTEDVFIQRVEPQAPVVAPPLSARRVSHPVPCETVCRQAQSGPTTSSRVLPSTLLDIGARRTEPHPILLKATSGTVAGSRASSIGATGFAEMSRTVSSRKRFLDLSADVRSPSSSTGSPPRKPRRSRSNHNTELTLNNLRSLFLPKRKTSPHKSAGGSVDEPLGAPRETSTSEGQVSSKPGNRVTRNLQLRI